MTSEVQRMIDVLGDQLQRSVVLNDPDVHMLYASQHYGDEDDVRIKAALYRDAGSLPIAHVLAQGVHTGTKPGRIPAAPELGLVSRLLVPVRWHGELLGSVVIIDADESLTAAEVALVEELVRNIAGRVVAERHAADQQAIADEADVRAWLSTDAAARAAGRDGLVSRGLLPDLDHLRVFVVVPTVAAPDGGSRDSSRVQVALRHAFDSVRGSVRGSALGAVREGQGSFVLLTPGDISDAKAVEVAGRLTREASDLIGGGDEVLVAVGDQVRSIDDAWQSHRQAELTTRAIPLLTPGPVHLWSSLGALQVLARIPSHELDETAVPAPVAALLESDPQGRLVETLETYLRHGGAGSATASALHIHRTTLYYRLDRIREITGVEIEDGDARLLLHVGLLVARMRALT